MDLATIRWWAALGTALALALTGSNSKAEHPAARRVVLAIDGVGEMRNLPVVLAERLGYFRDEGLIVTLVDAPADPTPMQLVKDGRSDGAVAYYHHTFMSQADDHLTTEAVVTMGVTPGLKVLVAERLRSRVVSIANLKGLSIFTGGGNSGKTTTANWMMIHAGLTIRDYTPLALKSRDDMAAALRDGSADAIVAHEPDAGFYLSSGAAFMLADIASVEGTRRTLGTVFPSTSLYLPQAYVEAHPDEVQHLVNACLKALAFINGHDAKAIASVLPAKMVGKDHAAFLRQVTDDRQMFVTDGIMPGDAARAEWEAMSAFNPKYRTVRLEDTFTNKFVLRALSSK